MKHSSSGGADPGQMAARHGWQQVKRVRETTDRVEAFQCIAVRDTLDEMAQAVSVRLDDEALRALRRLEATGMSRSEAIRKSVIAAASRLQDMRALASEVAALEADDQDRLEMLAVADLMESLRAPG